MVIVHVVVLRGDRDVDRSRHRPVHGRATQLRRPSVGPTTVTSRHAPEGCSNGHPSTPIMVTVQQEPAATTVRDGMIRNVLEQLGA